MKHTTKIRDITILINVDIIFGNAFVGFVSLQLWVSIQFQIIGKFVLSFIHEHTFFGVIDSWAWTPSCNHQNQIINENNHKIKYK